MGGWPAWKWLVIGVPLLTLAAFVGRCGAQWAGESAARADIARCLEVQRGWADTVTAQSELVGAKWSTAMFLSGFNLQTIQAVALKAASEQVSQRVNDGSRAGAAFKRTMRAANCDPVWRRE